MTKLAILCIRTLNQFTVDRHYGKMHVLFVAALLLATSSACPDICNCDSGEAQCRSAELTSVPEGFDEDTVSLDLSYNNISILKRLVFQNMPLLMKIIIRESDVEIVQQEAFSGLQQLETLDLHGNKIESLHPTIFQDNLNLAFLDLSDNSLKTFEPILISQLRFLNLSMNDITSESITSLMPLAHLETLDLSFNEISSLNSTVFETMDTLKHLDISGNEGLEFDCNLKPLWTLCRDRSVNCIIDDEESWNMLENLFCGVDEATEDDNATTPEIDFLSVQNSVIVSEASTDGEEGSGIVPDVVTSDANHDNSTGEVPQEPAAMEEGNWITIVIIVSVVLAVLLLFALVILCIYCRRKSRVESCGNLSRAHSIQYLNQADEFNPYYKNSRNNSIKKSDSKKIANNFDRVVNIPNYGKADSNRDIPLSDYVGGEIGRVPSFKNQGIAAPLNLPEEISPSHSLPRMKPASSYEDNVTVRAESLRRNPKSQHATLPDIQMIPPVRRASNKRR